MFEILLLFESENAFIQSRDLWYNYCECFLKTNIPFVDLQELGMASGF